ncbi:M15 family metallopeptidase [Winogradskyella schleiferi]|uniref:M15 family metallopeptidase n=1 Tax=Winogradskyella schleiferi TaxID=2686078 RepID=UPI0015C1C5EF|nr:M15 family metallopeptidase [Winogradskyella schleiferi]
MKQLIVLSMLSLLSFGCEKQVKSVNHVLKINGRLGQMKIKNAEDYNKAKTFVLGKFSYKDDTRFTKVKSVHSSKTLYLDNEVYNAFTTMLEAANKADVSLKIVSGTRNFDEQKAIWERKWNAYSNLEPIARSKKILEFSSMPSTSRHHWGTDMDLNSLNNSYFSSGKGQQEYQWLTNNANKFGFYQAYTTKEDGRKGYDLEKWHWSYLPLASQYLKFYNYNISYTDINGFTGDTLVIPNKMITHYVNGLSKKVIDYK